MKLNKSLFAILFVGFSSTFAFGAANSTPANSAAQKQADYRAKEDALAPEISLKDLKSLIDAKDRKSLVIIDANSEKSYKEGHIPGALHFEKIENHFASSLPSDKNTMIVAYCGGPMCSAWEDPAMKAKELGYTNIKHLRAGIKGWRDAKYPTQN